MQSRSSARKARRLPRWAICLWALLNELLPVRTRLWWCFFDVHMNSPLEGIFVALCSPFSPSVAANSRRSLKYFF
jgi:hypothetical protein